jgi:ATP/maltotriose-dependent transcriptional regulator MalT
LLREEHLERMRREGTGESFDLLAAREVLKLVAEGNSNPEIAAALLGVLTVGDTWEEGSGKGSIER